MGQASERDFHHTWFGEGAVTGQSGRHTWVLGAAVQRDRYAARELPVFDYDHVVPGVFAQDDFPVTSWLAVSASARGDFHNEYGSFFSPRISALVRTPTGWTARLSTKRKSRLRPGTASPSLESDCSSPRRRAS